jgi:hypothetical protein
MKDLPKSDANIQDANAANCAAHPTRGYNILESVHSRLARRVEQKVIVAPVAQYSKRSLRYPGQKREYQADLETKNDIEDNAELC